MIANVLVYLYNDVITVHATYTKKSTCTEMQKHYTYEYALGYVRTCCIYSTGGSSLADVSNQLSRGARVMINMVPKSCIETVDRSLPCMLYYGECATENLSVCDSWRLLIWCHFSLQIRVLSICLYSNISDIIFTQTWLTLWLSHYI